MPNIREEKGGRKMHSKVRILTHTVVKVFSISIRGAVHTQVITQNFNLNVIGSEKGTICILPDIEKIKSKSITSQNNSNILQLRR